MDFDLVIIGSGVLGATLSVEARRRGVAVACIGPDTPSPSFEAGQHFLLNTWSRAAKPSRVPSVETDQHPTLSTLIRRADRGRFPPAHTLSTAALTALRSSQVVRHFTLARDVSATARGVTVTTGTTRLSARAAVLCPGWGALKVELERERARALISRQALDFSTALQADLRGQRVGVVGAGPSALSFLEGVLGLGPTSRPEPKSLLWFRVGAPPTPETGVGKMFSERYGPLFRKVARSAHVEVVPARVTDATRTKGVWTLTTSDEEQHQVDALVWCGGFHAPLELISAHARTLQPLEVDGVRLALQRHQRSGPVPVFQVGPALDQLGLADWDTGPFSEWFEKGRRLLSWLEKRHG